MKRAYDPPRILILHIGCSNLLQDSFNTSLSEEPATEPAY